LKESEKAGDPKIAGKDWATRLAKEDGEEDDRFGESHSDNRLNEHFGGSFWVAAYGFASLEADKANTNRHCESGCGYVNFSGDFCEDVEHNMYR
jgi:hypothetical protein